MAINAVNKRKLRFLTAIFIRDQLHYVYVIHTHANLIFLNYKGGVLFLLVFEEKNYTSSHEED